MSRWLVTGADGQLGSALASLLDGHDVVALDSRDLDITDGTAVRDVVRVRPPDNRRQRRGLHRRRRRRK